MSRIPEKQKRILEIHERLTNDLPFFLQVSGLKIKDKSGGEVPLVLNAAQRMAHEQIEAQRARTGRVRAIILKGRQQGMSTYVAARFLHRNLRRRGWGTFILSHEASTTEKLFKIPKGMYESLAPQFRPPLKASNRKELIFEQINGSYFVGTAGSKNVGRGTTNQDFHGSEAAFWDNTDEIQAGVMESIPDADDTEVILESTANGMGNMYYELCINAMNGEGDYILIFIPWFIQAEYRREPEAGFAPTDHDDPKIGNEVELMELYGLDLEQIAWRRNKILTKKNGLRLFRQEYPCNPIEAFQTSGEGLFDPADIVRARKSKLTDKRAPLIMAVDPARGGADRTVILFRRGREIPKYYIYDDLGSEPSMRLASICATFINKLNPAKCFIDVGCGYGTIDRLKELGFNKVVEGIHFGGQANDSEIMANKRVEMYLDAAEWLSGEVSIPDSDDIHKDLNVIPSPFQNSSMKWQLESKVKIKKDSGFSPDIADAVALSFAMSTADVAMRQRSTTPKRKGGLSTTKKRREDKHDSGSGIFL